MSDDPQEVSQFKAALAKTPTETIIKKLDDNVIARQWKRDLAEAEVARRTRSDTQRSVGAVLNKSKHHRSAVVKGWIITVVLIFSAVLAAVAYVMK